MINNLKLHNFKAYKDQEFEFGNLTVFCGNNSVGKSTAIQAISIPLQSYFDSKVTLNGPLSEVGTIDDALHKHALNASLEIELVIDGQSVSWGYDDTVDREGISKSNRHLIVKRLPTKELYDSLKNILESFQYLQAERYGPRSNFDITESNRFHTDWLGAKGEFTAELLSQSDSIRRLFVGGVFHADETQRDPRLHTSEPRSLLHRQVDAWMKEISPGISVTSKLFEDASVAVNVFDQNESKSLKPHNVGFGVSYALSIVTALLYTRVGGLVILENPEAHLHPRGQSYLGRLIALTAQAGVQVIVETHSDHLINGMRLMPRLGLVDASKMKIYQVYADLEDKCSKVIPITVNKQGELSEWPEQFFDQQLIDMDILMSGRDQ
ncbi:DUF3696 domain-containing protein [Vibrio fluvialis]|nr:DUF3696 domain-containing protein [Vibrio fluvialis]